MLSINSLYTLIQSMTKSEKRYFRLQNADRPGDRGFMKLYNLLETEISREGSGLESLPSMFPGSTIEPARKHLYRVLMRALRQFELDKNIEAKLSSLLQDSKILLDRGFIEASAQTLARAKEIAFKNEKFIHFILLAQQELRLETHSQYSRISESDLIAKQEAITRLLQHEVSSHQHFSIYEVLLLRYWKGKSINTSQKMVSLRDLLLEEHYILNSQSLESFEARQIHLLFQSTFMLMTGDSIGSMETLYELDQLFRQHEHLWSKTPIYYVQTLNGILHTLRRMEKYEEMSFFIDRLSGLQLDSENMRLSVKSQVMEHKLHAWLNLGLFNDCLELIQNQVQKFEKSIELLSLYDQAQLLFSISRFWYLSGNLSKALQFINQILNKASLLMNKQLLVKYQLTYFMIHKGLDNRDLLAYELRSYERKIKKEGGTYKAEVMVLELLKNWIGHRPTGQFYEALLQLSEDPFEQILISDLGLKAWFKENS